MKKILLILLAFTLTLSIASCAGDDDNKIENGGEDDKRSEEEKEKDKHLLPAITFYNTYIIINNHGMTLSSIVDECIEEYQKKGSIPAMQVENKGNGSFLLTIAINKLAEKYYDILEGELLVAVSSSGESLTNNGSTKKIDLTKVFYKDSYIQQAYSYKGTIEIATTKYNPATNERTHSISYNNLSMLNPSSANLWLINHTFTYQITPKQEGNNTLLSSGNPATGAILEYGAFSVRIAKPIEKSASMGCYTKGEYLLNAQSLGGSSAPITTTFSIENVNEFSIGKATISYKGVSTTYDQHTSF